MEQNWRDQLQSDDPKIRAQAVKKLAASGNHDNLKYLKEIVENDPDPQLREYARKAARHLYSSQAPPAPERRIPRLGFREGPSPFAKKSRNGKIRSLARDWRIRGAPIKEAMAEERVAAMTPAHTNESMAATRLIAL